MGIKSTVKLTRKQAEDRYLDMRLEALTLELKKSVTALSNKFLEDELERLNDGAHQDSSPYGTGFDNYIITEEYNPKTRAQIAVVVIADICRELNVRELSAEQYDQQLQLMTEYRLGYVVDVATLQKMLST